MHKAPGPDGLPNWLLRDFSSQLRTMYGKNVFGHVSDDVAPSGRLNNLDDDVYPC